MAFKPGGSSKSGGIKGIGPSAKMMPSIERLNDIPKTGLKRFPKLKMPRLKTPVRIK